MTARGSAASYRSAQVPPSRPSGVEVWGRRFAPVPKVLHQTWKSSRVPAAWEPFRASWRRHHPDWQHRLWTDEDNRRLIARHHPWFLPTYDGFPRAIQRVDAAKYFILYTQGGAYADLDCECVEPVDALLASGGAVVGRTQDGVIEGAFLASPPGHPLWQVAAREMTSPPWIARFLHHVPGFDASNVLFSTGPRMLARAVRRYRTACASGGMADGLTVYPPQFFSSRSWLRRHEPFPPGERTYLRHHYSDSWLLPAERRVTRLLRADRLVTALLAVLLAALVGAAACRLR